MGRPLKATAEPLANGRFRASLPNQRGSKSRTTFTFDRHDDARRWLDDGVVALDLGEPLPEPATYVTTIVQPQVPASKVTLRYALDEFHDSRYGRNDAAQLRRADSVRRDFERHVLSYFRLRGVFRLADLDPRVNGNASRIVDEWINWLSGNPDDGLPDYDHGPLAVSTDELVDVAAAAELFGKSEQTVHRGIRRHGLLPDAAGGYRVEELLDAGIVDETRGLAKSTAARIIQALKMAFGYAREQGWLQGDPLYNKSAKERYGGEADLDLRRRPVPLALCARLARHLSPIHQLVLWLERIVGLRQGEAYGILVEDVVDLGGFGLLHVLRQGGELFTVRDEYGRRRRKTEAELKTQSSKRLLLVPPAVMSLIRIVIEAHHTDPVSGEVDGEARLIPGLQKDDEAGKNSFYVALKEAGRKEGLSVAEVKALHPHRLRKSVATDLTWQADRDELGNRRFLGHVAGEDVHARSYILDDLTLAPMRAVAERLQDAIETQVGDLLVPTSVHNSFGVRTRSRRQLDVIEAVFVAHGWRSERDTDELTPMDVAHDLGLAVTTVRRQMQEGTIPARKRQWGRREVWVTDRATLEEYKARGANGIDLTDLADELGMTYHQAYRMLGELGLHPQQGNGDRLRLNAAEADQLRSEAARVRALHRRAMRVSEAATLLGVNPRTFRGWVTAGRLELDPETDSSRAKFVTRTSVEELRTQRSPTRHVVSGAEGTLSLLEASELTQLPRQGLLALIKRGELETVTAARSRRVIIASLRRWATAYRPDVLDALEREVG
jgi:hypothetical protein